MSDSGYHTYLQRNLPNVNAFTVYIVYLMFLSTSKVGRIAILATFVYDNSTQPLIDGVYIRHVCTISMYDKCV